jgi:integrase
MTRQPRKILTAASVRKYRPGPERREIADAEIRGLRLVIHPSGARSWIMRFRKPGPKNTTVKLTLGTADLDGDETEAEPQMGGHLTLAAARSLATEVNRQRKLGRNPAADYMDRKRTARTGAAERAASTFGAAARSFVLEYAKPRTRRWSSTAALLGLKVTGGSELETIRGGLADRWAEKPVKDVTAHDIFAVVEETRRRGVPGLPRLRREGTSNSSARVMHAALSKMFGWLAERPGTIDKNPVAGLKRPDAAAARERVLSDNEVRWFWSACDQLSEPFGALLRLLLITGARREEVARMTRSEHSEDGATWTLTGERTKNHRAHEVPLSPLAREILGGVKQIASRQGYMFTTTGIAPVTSFSTTKERLDALMLELARKEAVAAGRDPGEVKIEPWRIHDLRRTAITGMARAGADLHVIERAINHASGTFGGIVGVYQKHKFEAEKRKALEAWANLLTEITSRVPRGNVVALRQGA